MKIDLKKAAKWYIKAAEQGVVEAQFNIAMFYKFGRGVKNNQANSMKWLIKAAEQGDEKAKKILGDLKGNV